MRIHLFIAYSLNATLRGPDHASHSSGNRLCGPFELAAGSPLAHFSPREAARCGCGLASVLAMGMTRRMVRRRDLAPRRRELCSASAACNSSVERTSAMVVGCSDASSGCTRSWRSAMLLQPSQGLPHVLFSMRCLVHALRMNARSNDCHVGHTCMMQCALESRCGWVRARYVV